MKLIDADELCRKFNSGGGESEKIQIRPDMPVKAIIDMTLAAYRKCLFAEIGKMPAAYDVDKVVEQLKSARDKECNSSVPKIKMCDAIDIVKSSGIE